MQWADRTEYGEGTSEWALAVAAFKAQGGSAIDLTVSNPTRCNFSYDPQILLPPLQDETNLNYTAEPFGPRCTRQTIVEQYYAPKGICLTPDQLMLTASTSEAYGYLFRLLCNPGDEVLVPQPSYPLFDLLAQLQDVNLVHYPLQMHDGWTVAPQNLEQLLTDRTRAIVIVHPNNPTGHLTTEDDRANIERFAEQHGLAMIVDEVFLDYAYERTAQSFLQGSSPALTFVLSGLSKVLALPQMKLAWTAVHGPGALCEEALRRLEFIADTFLSLSAPVANATGSWLQWMPAIQGQVLHRIGTNLKTLDGVLGREPLLTRLPAEGGWSVVLRIPAVESDEATSLRLLQEEGVLVHPGSFYAFPSRGFLVMSLLVEATRFEAGINALANVIHRLVTGESR